MISLIKKTDDKYIACDTETTSLKWYQGNITGHCIACRVNGEYYGFYIPLAHTKGDNYEDPLEAGEILNREIYCDDKLHKVFFNAKFDLNFLHKEAFGTLTHGPDPVIPKSEDAMLLAFLRNENEKSHRLKALAVKYLDPSAADEEKELTTYIKQNEITNYADIPVSIIGPYGAKDAVITLQLWNYVMEFKITPEQSPHRDGVRMDIYEHERDFMLVAAKMERTGFPFDVGICKDISRDVETARAMLEDEIYDKCGVRFSITSDKELNSVLVDKLGHAPVTISKKTGDPSWDRSALLRLNNEVGELIASYRNLAHHLSTFGTTLAERVVNGRIYGSYNQIGTRTGRASASEPNLQQIPTRLPRYKRVPDYVNFALKRAFSIRKAFRAPEGYSILSIDESQFELRMLDHYAQDAKMHEAFETDKDIHSFTACLLFNYDYDDFVRKYNANDPECVFYRIVAKEINFAIVYGAGYKRVHSTLLEYGVQDISLSDVREFFWRHKEIFSGVTNFVNTVQNTVRRRGYLFNHYGRHKRVPADKAYVGVNHLIQGVTADMLKHAAIKCSALLTNYSSSLIMMVHDETLFLLHNRERHLIPELKGMLEDFDWTRTKIVAEVSVGPSWGELE